MFSSEEAANIACTFLSSYCDMFTKNPENVIGMYGHEAFAGFANVNEAVATTYQGSVEIAKYLEIVKSVLGGGCKMELTFADFVPTQCGGISVTCNGLIFTHLRKRAFAQTFLLFRTQYKENCVHVAGSTLRFYSEEREEVPTGAIVVPLNSLQHADQRAAVQQEVKPKREKPARKERVKPTKEDSTDAKPEEKSAHTPIVSDDNIPQPKSKRERPVKPKKEAPIPEGDQEVTPATAEKKKKPLEKKPRATEKPAAAVSPATADESPATTVKQERPKKERKEKKKPLEKKEEEAPVVAPKKPPTFAEAAKGAGKKDAPAAAVQAEAKKEPASKSDAAPAARAAPKKPTAPKAPKNTTASSSAAPAEKKPVSEKPMPATAVAAKSSTDDNSNKERIQRPLTSSIRLEQVPPTATKKDITDVCEKFGLIDQLTLNLKDKQATVKYSDSESATKLFRSRKRLRIGASHIMCFFTE